MPGDLASARRVHDCRSRGLQGRTEASKQAYAYEPYPVRMVDRGKFAARYQPAVVAAPAGYSSAPSSSTPGQNSSTSLDRWQSPPLWYCCWGVGHAWSGRRKSGEWPNGLHGIRPTTCTARPAIATAHRTWSAKSARCKGALSLSQRRGYAIIAFMAPLNPGQSAPRPHPVASACSTRTLSICTRKYQLELP